MRVDVFGLPQTKGSTRAVLGADGLPRVFSDNARLKQWQEAVGWGARAAGATLHAGAVKLDLVFALPQPKRVTGEVPITRPDLDKLVRAVLDALTGICYRDDGQVTQLHARKCYSPRGVPPGVVIIING